MEEVTKIPATQYYVVVDGHSWASFIITDKGDLFINSDWGYWAYAWRAFGTDFRAFLADLGSDYLIAKLETNQFQMLRVGRKTIPKRSQEAIAALFAKFQEELKKELIDGRNEN